MTFRFFLADINAVTKGEKQTPMHYAAKNNATASLKTLLKLGAAINARDFKMRTPLFVAAESGKNNASHCFILLFSIILFGAFE